MILTRTTSGTLPSEMLSRLAGRGAFQTYMIGVIREAVDPVVQELYARSSPASIAQAYGVRHRLIGKMAGVDIVNTNPHWIWKEYDTRGAPRGFPPYKAGTSLYIWAHKHGKSPWWTAKNIFLYGTKGNYLFTTVWQRSFRKVETEVKMGYRRYIRFLMTGVE